MKNLYQTVSASEPAQKTWDEIEKLLDTSEYLAHCDSMVAEVVEHQSTAQPLDQTAFDALAATILDLYKNEYDTISTRIYGSTPARKAARDIECVGDAVWYSSADCGWIESYAHYFSVVSDAEATDDTRALLDFREYIYASGVTQIHLYEDGRELILICELIGTHKIDAENRRHCDDGAASIWSNGDYEYWYEGVQIPNNYIDEPLTPQIWSTIEDVDVRASLLGYLGNDKLIEALDLEIVDRDVERDLILYSTKEIDTVVNQKLTFLRMVCPSSERVYVLPCEAKSTAWLTMQSMWSMPDGVDYAPDVEA